jgi:hypothetical protein
MDLHRSSDYGIAEPNEKQRELERQYTNEDGKNSAAGTIEEVGH